MKRLDEKESVYRELVLFKIKLGGASDSTKISNVANTYGAKIHDGRKDSIIIELTSTPDQINAFEESMKPFGILDSARTGVTALQGN